MKVKEFLRTLVAFTVMVCAVATDAIADIPAPKTESTGTDWSFVLMGGVSASSALCFSSGSDESCSRKPKS